MGKFSLNGIEEIFVYFHDFDHFFAYAHAELEFLQEGKQDKKEQKKGSVEFYLTTSDNCRQQPQESGTSGEDSGGGEKG